MHGNININDRLFFQEYDDVDLWHDLIDFSINKPYFVHVLLHNIGTHVDPRILVERIENGREIPGLRDSLVQIMQDYRLQVSFFSSIFCMHSIYIKYMKP